MSNRTNLALYSYHNSVLMANLRPVLCEIDNDSLCIDLNKIKKCITKNTKVIIPVIFMEILAIWIN